jgi:hypothetical protein
MMPKICYVPKTFSNGSMAIIAQANSIIDEYAHQGFDLTLRQIYYQFVSRGLIPNRDTEYKRLGSIINDARLAGLIDWNAITDRTRNLRSLSHWENPGDIIYSAAQSYHIDRWAGQEYRIEVWIEKDALVGVIAGICNEMDIPYFSCRGYTSQSEMWVASRRLLRYISEGHTPLVLHLGDHDPSGKDMTRDIVDRLTLFTGSDVDLKRLALNMDQVEIYNPPPNPAKITDSRATAYIAEFGDESWELDALEPTVIAKLIQDAAGEVIDQDAWDDAVANEKRGKNLLNLASAKWSTVERRLAKQLKDI